MSIAMRYLGPHFLPGDPSEFMAWARLKTPPAWMMISEVDDSWFRFNGYMLNALGPRTRLFVKRIETPPNFESDPEGTAIAYAASFAPLITMTDTLGLSRSRVVWGGLNEIGVGNDKALMEKFVRFEVQLLKQGKTMNVHFGVGGWAMGNPADSQMLKLWKPVLQALKDTQMGLYNLHAYGDLDDDFAFRYHQHHDIFESLGFHNLPMLMTEFGLDAPGWHSIYKNDKNEPDLSAYFYDYLLPAAKQFAKDGAYFCGAEIFCLNDAGSWKGFDIANFHPGIVELSNGN
jgi:hypothetical protein